MILAGSDRLAVRILSGAAWQMLTDYRTARLGVSAYSRAPELIEEGDRRYSNICWEYEGTQLAVHVATTMLKYNRDLDKFEYPGGQEQAVPQRGVQHWRNGQAFHGYIFSGDPGYGAVQWISTTR